MSGKIKEWTDKEIEEKIFSNYKMINGERWYSIDEMKAMIKDPRFPKSKVQRANEFMVKIEQMQKNKDPRIINL